MDGLGRLTLCLAAPYAAQSVIFRTSDCLLSTKNVSRGSVHISLVYHLAYTRSPVRSRAEKSWCAHVYTPCLPFNEVSSLTTTMFRN
jgi:hypothetical protein